MMGPTAEILSQRIHITSAT